MPQTTADHRLLPYPTGILRLVLRLPLYLYRLGLGKLMTVAPFIILTTRGRKSGLPRHTVLEFRRHGSKYYVVSGWGKRPQWYQNLLVDPNITLQYGDAIYHACAIPVDNSAEALRVLYMFHRNSPLYEAVLANVTGNEQLTLRTLNAHADQFTIVRLELQADSTPPLPGVEPLPSQVRYTLLGGMALLLLLPLFRAVWRKVAKRT